MLHTIFIKSRINFLKSISNYRTRSIEHELACLYSNKIVSILTSIRIQTGELADSKRINSKEKSKFESLLQFLEREIFGLITNKIVGGQNRLPLLAHLFRPLIRPNSPNVLPMFPSLIPRLDTS